MFSKISRNCHYNVLHFSTSLFLHFIYEISYDIHIEINRLHITLFLSQFDNSNRNSLLVCFYIERPILHTFCNNRIIILASQNSFQFKESIRFSK